MPVISCADDGADQLVHLRRLIAVRWVALALMAALTLLAPAALGIPLPTAPLLAIIGITALFNGIALWRARRADSAAPVELLESERILARMQQAGSVSALEVAWSLDSTNSELLRRKAPAQGAAVLLAEGWLGNSQLSVSTALAWGLGVPLGAAALARTSAS